MIEMFISVRASYCEAWKFSFSQNFFPTVIKLKHEVERAEEKFGVVPELETGRIGG
jgi:hypothetical protein